MNLIQASNDRKLFKPFFRDPETWSAWRTFLKALFGLKLTVDEQGTYAKCTDRLKAPPDGFREAWLVCGRRGGKSFNLALIAVYLAAFKDWRPYLTAGERAHIVIVAADRKQAKVIFGYIRALLTETKMLAELVSRETSEEIELTNAVTIEVATCSFRTIRGRTIVAALLDEVAFWQSENSANPDFEVLAAIRPAMATVPGAMLLCASSPYARRGALWDAHQRHYGQDEAPVLVWRAPTLVMNPTVPQAFIDAEFEKDPASAAAEYNAEFRTDVERLLTHEAVTACVNSGVFEQPPERRHNYFGFIDASGGSGDSFAMAIAHKEGKTTILDLVRDRPPPFSPEAVIEEYSRIFKNYRITSIKGDKYAGQFPVELFRKNGINLEPAERTKSELYGDLVAVINSGAVDLLDNNKLTSQLVGLERRTRTGGRDLIDHPPGGHDDVANAAAGAIVLVDSAGGDPRFWRDLHYRPLGTA
jgi:hypothetical protein